MNEHEIYTNKYNIELCKKCGLPKERLTTHCYGKPLDYLTWHRAVEDSIDSKKLDYINGELVYNDEA